ncbi:uncharacterized protein LOC123873963 [Maniola jurtina]|uniref:uncharacterized protein LOC123873963 n=1 Tax=Maniola jurtina TaxID=191418 RepID=UPI001E686A2B|nr:uncharacterized protein LOC123873963 [Maniola jurtina]XP_045775041.1 uncharacterized protein LOC123873963 [Maniola jurtina]
MALGYIYFLVFTALVAVNIIFADDSLLSDANQIDLTESASRQARHAPEPPQERLLFTQITSCDYSSTPGRYCESCTQAVRCLPSGNGIARTCWGFFPYCNGGYCSFIPGPACNATTTE